MRPGIAGQPAASCSTPASVSRRTEHARCASSRKLDGAMVKLRSLSRRRPRTRQAGTSGYIDAERGSASTRTGCAVIASSAPGRPSAASSACPAARPADVAGAQIEQMERLSVQHDGGRPGLAEAALSCGKMFRAENSEGHSPAGWSSDTCEDPACRALLACPSLARASSSTSALPPEVPLLVALAGGHGCLLRSAHRHRRRQWRRRPPARPLLQQASSRGVVVPDSMRVAPGRCHRPARSGSSSSRAIYRGHGENRRPDPGPRSHGDPARRFSRRSPCRPEAGCAIRRERAPAGSCRGLAPPRRRWPRQQPHGLGAQQPPGVGGWPVAATASGLHPRALGC